MNKILPNLNIEKSYKNSVKGYICGIDEVGRGCLAGPVVAAAVIINFDTIPEGINDLDVRSTLLNNYNIEIGGGLGPLAGKIWRIGLMGHTARKENIDKLINALSVIL